ncbi:RNA polymerase sigma factor [Paractinoplanes deccanensis]|uniref:RNA polymerase sigma factor n=1 Tax=Paractinoplanes deccanensis TaxID=113561 RepID=UPI001945B175|nr:sigma-70 family RNA polymerase sigma factor [Actinoplanes deccanensis]
MTFAAFYESHYRWLFVRMRAEGLGEQDAGDVAQEAMLRLYRQWSELDRHSEKALKVYAFTTAKRIRIDRARQAVRQRTGYAAMAPLVRTAEDDAYGSTEALDILRVLDEPSREVMSLLYDGLRICEIAEKLGRNPSTVRSQLQKAREILRPLLALGKETKHGR